MEEVREKARGKRMEREMGKEREKEEGGDEE